MINVLCRHILFGIKRNGERWLLILSIKKQVLLTIAFSSWRVVKIIPIITTGGAGGLTDPVAIQISDLSRTYNDPLAAKVRSQLRNEHNFPRNSKRSFRIECVFSGQQPVYPKSDGTVSHEKPGIHGISLDCSMGYGSATTVTATFGNVAASRVINKTLQKHKKK